MLFILECTVAPDIGFEYYGFCYFLIDVSYDKTEWITKNRVITGTYGVIWSTYYMKERYLADAYEQYQLPTELDQKFLDDCKQKF